MRRIARLLEEMYGVPSSRREDPLNALIATVLSQNTSDANSGRAFVRLKSRFGTWAEVRRASVDDIADAIACGGLARTKAGRIKGILERIHAEHGCDSLAFLEAWDTEDARRYLASFVGVGPKTAACVLLFGCGRPVFPVDTHVLRIARRLGLVEDRVDAGFAHESLGRMVPRELVYNLHMNMITHGRRRCRPHNPRCAGCLLAPECRLRKEDAPG